MKENQCMSIEEIAAQALAERNERRKNWALYRKLPLEAIEEMLQKPLDPAQRAALLEYLLVLKRQMKANFEKHEKLGDFREKAALPIAISIAFFGAWSMGLGRLPAGWHPWVILGFNTLAAGVWLAVRQSGFHIIAKARDQLAALGKVD